MDNARFDGRDFATFLIQLAVLGILHLVLGDDLRQLGAAANWEWRLPAMPVVLAIVALAAVARCLDVPRLNLGIALALVVSAHLLHKPRDFLFDYALHPELADMCSVVRDNVPRDAVVFVPPDWAHFQYYYRRAAFVTFVHLPLQFRRITEWAERLKLYGVLPANQSFANVTRRVKTNYGAYDKLRAENFMRIADAYRRALRYRQRPFAGTPTNPRQFEVPPHVVE